MINKEESLGQIIHTARLEKQYTLRELADKVYLSHGYLSKIENGRAKPSEDSLRLLAENLDLDADELNLLAGRISEEAQPLIQENCQETLTFFRGLKDKKVKKYNKQQKKINNDGR